MKRIVVKQGLTHQGKRRRPGDIIDLRPDQAAWLDHEGITELIPEAQQPYTQSSASEARDELATLLNQHHSEDNL